MAKGIKNEIKKAMSIIDREISGNASSGKYGAGLSAEGYAGGYRQALSDVILLLNGVQPNTRDYWKEYGKRR